MQDPRHTCSCNILEYEAANTDWKPLLVIGNVFFRILPGLGLPSVHKSEILQAEKYIFIFKSQLMQFILEKKYKNQKYRRKWETQNI